MGMSDLWMDTYEKAREEYKRDQDRNKYRKTLQELGYEPEEVDEHIEAFSNEA